MLCLTIKSRSSPKPKAETIVTFKPSLTANIWSDQTGANHFQPLVSNLHPLLLTVRWTERNWVASDLHILSQIFSEKNEAVSI